MTILQKNMLAEVEYLTEGGRNSIMFEIPIFFLYAVISSGKQSGREVQRAAYLKRLAVCQDIEI